MPEWISIKDRTPDEDGLYLCWAIRTKLCPLFEGPMIKQWSTEHEGFWNPAYLVNYDNITHWMELPEQPVN